MVGYLKSKSSFATYKTVNVSESELVLFSTSRAESSVTLTQELNIELGDYLVIDGNAWVIIKSEPQSGQTKLSMGDVSCIFDRNLIYTDTSATSVESFIVNEISSKFTNQTDAAYQYAYIAAASTTATEFVSPDVKDGIYNLLDYVEYVRRICGVHVDIAVTTSGISISVHKPTPSSHKIIFGEMGYLLSKENYAFDAIAKVTAVLNGVGTDYYLMADGTITTAPGQGERASGKWEAISVSEDDVVLEKVTDVIEKNKYTHSIEFFGTAKLNLLDVVYLKLHDMILESVVTQCVKVKGDNRYYYKSGELKVTLTEKLRGVT